MDYATLATINPKLIYASITGYGQTGPYSNRAGYDVMVEAYVSSHPENNIHKTDAGEPVRWDSCILLDLEMDLQSKWESQ